MKRNILSIEIGSLNIKIVLGREAKGSLMVDRALTLRTPKESYFDGQIRDMDSIKNIIKIALEENNIKAKNVIFTLESSKVLTREITLPSVSEKEVIPMIEYEIEENFPIDLQNYIVQYRILENFREEAIDKTRILVSALPREIAKGYYHLTDSLNLNPLALDIQPNVVNKFINNLWAKKSTKDVNNKTLAIIDLGHSNINLVIIENCVFRFSRLLKNGGRDIDENISRLCEVTVEDGKRKKELLEDLNCETGNFENLRLANTVKSTLNEWTGDLQRMFKYYTSRSPGNKIDEILIYGGSSNIEGIDKYLEYSFEIPVYRIDKYSEAVKISDSEINLANYINPLGGLIRR